MNAHSKLVGFVFSHLFVVTRAFFPCWNAVWILIWRLSCLGAGGFSVYLCSIGWPYFHFGIALAGEFLEFGFFWFFNALLGSWIILRFFLGNYWCLGCFRCFRSQLVVLRGCWTRVCWVFSPGYLALVGFRCSLVSISFWWASHWRWFWSIIWGGWFFVAVSRSDCA